MTGPGVAEVRAGLARIQDRIHAAGGEVDAVQVLAVTKGLGLEAVRAAVDVGLVEVGENYAQELLAKSLEAAGWSQTPRWHFIGGLQRNKVRALADAVWCWQSLDRTELVEAVASRAPGARVMIQVDAVGSAGKSGAPPAEVPGLVARAQDLGLDVVGLMTVGVAGDDQATRDSFLTVARLADRLALEQRSMGMTADLEIAVRAGSTMVRVGTALFGPRPSRPGSGVRGDVGRA